jgi:hypothetical protein
MTAYKDSVNLIINGQNELVTKNNMVVIQDTLQTKFFKSTTTGQSVDASKVIDMLDQWEDENIAGITLGAGSSGPDLIALNTTPINVYAFDGGATIEQLYGMIEIPHAYKQGSDITLHIHWMPTTTGTGNVKWGINYQWVNAGDVYSSSATLATVTVAASGTAWDGTNTDVVVISGTGKNISSQFAFRLFRDPSDAADTYAGDAALINVGIHYQKDGNGSNNITSK